MFSLILYVSMVSASPPTETHEFVIDSGLTAYECRKKQGRVRVAARHSEQVTITQWFTCEKETRS